MIEIYYTRKGRVAGIIIKPIKYTPTYGKVKVRVLEELTEE